MSSLDICRIAVKASSAHGGFKKDTEGTVRFFCQNRSQAYTAVYQHVKKCPDCTPEEALRAILATRERPHLGGMVSGGLIQLAEKMDRIEGKHVPRALIREFVWRQGNIHGLLFGKDGVDASECVMGLNLIFGYQVRKHEKEAREKRAQGVRRKFLAVEEVNVHLDGQASTARFGDIGRLAARIFDRDGRVSPGCDELRDLCTVADVLVA